MSKFSKKDVFYLSIIVLLLLTIAGMRFMPQPEQEPIVYNYIGELETYQNTPSLLTEAAPKNEPETVEVSSVPEEPIELEEEPPPVSTAAQASAPSKTTTKITSGEAKININTASQTQLMRLPGVGEATANKIIEYRNANGKFNAVKDIMKVSGIGEKTYEKILEFIEVD